MAGAIVTTCAAKGVACKVQDYTFFGEFIAPHRVLTKGPYDTGINLNRRAAG